MLSDRELLLLTLSMRYLLSVHCLLSFEFSKQREKLTLAGAGSVEELTRGLVQ